MTTSESKGRFFYKTNRFESIRITNRIDSIRIANWNALPPCAYTYSDEQEQPFAAGSVCERASALRACLRLRTMTDALVLPQFN